MRGRQVLLALLLSIAFLLILRRTMTRFTLAAVIGSTRRLLAVIIAVLAITATAYLSSHKLNNPDHYQYGGCGYNGLYMEPPPCRPPTRAAWQIPLAVVIAVLGSAAAVAAAGPRWRPVHERVLSRLDV